MFLDQLQGTREVTETEPGLFRRSEISGDGYKVFSLTSLLPKYEYTVHLAKMSCKDSAWRVCIQCNYCDRRMWLDEQISLAAKREVYAAEVLEVILIGAVVLVSEARELVVNLDWADLYGL